MGSFVFVCPTTGPKVQSWASDETLSFDHFEAVECAACKHASGESSDEQSTRQPRCDAARFAASAKMKQRAKGPQLVQTIEDCAAAGNGAAITELIRRRPRERSWFAPA